MKRIRQTNSPFSNNSAVHVVSVSVDDLLTLYMSKENAMEA